LAAPPLRTDMDNSPAHLSDYTGPLAAFPLERESESNANYRGWHERRRVPDDRTSCVEYAVSGTTSDPDFPYVDGVPTLREAITIARLYPGIYHDGAATHIVRRTTRRVESDPNARSTGLTHRWRVFPDGQFELLVAYGTKRPNLSGWLEQIEHPATVRHASRAFRSDHPAFAFKPLATELTDLSAIARQLGYAQAVDAIRPLIAEAHMEAFPVKRWSGSAKPAAEDAVMEVSPAQQTRPGLLARAAVWARNLVT
jgi:hypothetical protein